MPACRDVVRKYSSEELDSTSLIQRLLLRIHLMMCVHCRNYVNQVGAIGLAVKNMVRKSSASEHDIRRLEDQVIDRLSSRSDGLEP